MTACVCGHFGVVDEAGGVGGVRRGRRGVVAGVLAGLLCARAVYVIAFAMRGRPRLCLGRGEGAGVAAED